MIVLITGSRTFPNDGFIDNVLTDAHRKDPITMLILGDCPTGADHIAREWAYRNDVPYVLHVADWKRHGRAAGPIRNGQMVATAKAFWAEGETVYACAFVDKALGASRGTYNCVKQVMDDTLIPVRVYRPNGETVLMRLR